MARGSSDQLLGVTAVRREALSAAFIRRAELLVGFARAIFPDLTPHRQAQQGGRRRAAPPDMDVRAFLSINGPAPRDDL